MERKKNMDPLRLWVLLTAIGLGALVAFIMDELILADNENPALYPGIILTMAGLSQLLFRSKND